MLKRTYEGQDCSIAHALEVVGERWTAWPGLMAAEKIVCFEWVRRYSMISVEAATKPPVLASDFERLPQMTSTLSFSPK